MGNFSLIAILSHRTLEISVPSNGSDFLAYTATESPFLPAAKSLHRAALLRSDMIIDKYDRFATMRQIAPSKVTQIILTLTEKQLEQSHN